MGVFDDILSGTKKAARQVGKKANELFEITKVNMDISGVEDKMNAVYADIGKEIYTLVREKSFSAGEEILSMCDEVDALLKEKEELQDRASQLKNERRCASCGAVNRDASTFCSSCGKEL